MGPQSDQMITRLDPGAAISTASGFPPAHVQEFRIPTASAFVIEIPSSDGKAMLLRMTEENGRLVVTGDESRWTEGAKRFIHMMMQWSGQAGLRWREKAEEAG